MKRIEKIDANFQMQGVIPEGWLLHSPWQKPFLVWGLVPNEERTFCRLPLSFLPNCTEGVQNLAYHLAGGCIRFSTDARGIGLVWKLKSSGVMPHFTACGQSGMELYEESDRGFFPVRNFLPRMNNGLGCTLEQTGYTDLPGGMRSYVLYLPLYNGLDMLQLALPPEAKIGPGRTPRVEKPIVFYGSSITQGGCATRCGSCYTHILCRRLDAAHVNLGFAGNAKGEERMARYIASLPMSAFVMDYDHNAPDAAHLEKTHLPFFRIIRDARPELPILLLSKPDFDKNPDMARKRRTVIRRTYETALSWGDEHVWMVDGEKLFGTRDRELCTVDGCHPNDLGFLRMANTLEPILKHMLEKEA